MNVPPDVTLRHLLHPDTGMSFPGTPIKGPEPNLQPLGVVFNSKHLWFHICLLFSPDLPTQPEKTLLAVNPFRRPTQPLQVRPDTILNLIPLQRDSTYTCVPLSFQKMS